MKKLTFVYCVSLPFMVLTLQIIDQFWNTKSRFKEEHKVTVVHNVTKHTITDLSFKPTFRHILLVAQPRTGSTVIGKVLSYSDSIFYSLEPLNLALRTSTVKFYDYNSFTKFLKDLLLCKINKFENYTKIRKERLWHLTSILVRDICYHGYVVPKSYCDIRESFIDENVCHISKIHLMKTIYFPLKESLNLLQDPDLDVAVIYLVRDPRGTLNSREYSIDSSFFFSSSLKDENSLCSQLREDFFHFQRIKNKFPNRLLQIRYEDFALNPMKETKKMYKFLGIKYTKITESMLTSLTMNVKERNPKDAFSTNRNAKLRVFQWRQSMPFEKVLKIQKSCHQVLKFYGYKLFPNESHYSNIFNGPLTF